MHSTVNLIWGQGRGTSGWKIGEYGIKQRNICLWMHLSVQCRRGACCFTVKWVALLFFLCHQVFSTNTQWSVASEIQVREKKRGENREKDSKRTPVSADLIGYHNPTKQSLLIYINTPRQFLQIPPTLPNVTVKKYPNPQTRGDSIIILIMLFLFHFPQLKVSRGVCEWENKSVCLVLGSTPVILRQVQKLACRK